MPGLSVLVVTNSYPSRDAPGQGAFVADQVESLRKASITVEVLHLDRRTHGRRAYPSLAHHVRAAIQSGRPDVVHVTYGGVMADIATRAIRDRPVVVSFCGTDLLGGGGSGLVGRASRRYNVIASRRAARRASGIVVKARNLREALPKGIDPGQVWIVPSGVDLARFRPLEMPNCRTQLGWDPSIRHVLFPADHSRVEKRFELARAAVALLQASGHEVELHALSGVPHADVPTWINAADAVVLTSIHEGSPNAIKEALACNVPVVSVDVGDAQERIQGLAGCFLAEPTPSDVAARLELALRHGRLHDGRSRVAELSLERVASTLESIYRALVGA